MSTAKLISYSVVPASNKSYYAQNMEDLIAYCARVSNPSNQNNTNTAEKLVRYLMKNDHWSNLQISNKKYTFLINSISGSNSSTVQSMASSN